MSYQCSNCNFTGCSCKRKIAADGKKCCTKCYEAYNAKLAKLAETKK